ncbi:hypothetical protein LVY72_03740 [Arthrobacter sp. I2-34]|uniref:DUF222 domain-containing protein n=1 Tax=Arthrobacter hankyongi TaxID=2904801 RepID=A0ABS9L311_9MICC|nr:hypothetical protein [Arthrobacter hankyongi]MCG2621024.1 hypothetical protein [Arthrobacter hankyongi]
MLEFHLYRLLLGEWAGRLGQPWPWNPAGEAGIETAAGTSIDAVDGPGAGAGASAGAAERPGPAVPPAPPVPESPAASLPAIAADAGDSAAADLTAADPAAAGPGPGRAGLPAGWQQLSPTVLAAALGHIDPDGLDDWEAIGCLRATAKVTAWIQSVRVRALCRLAELRPAEDTGPSEPDGFSRFAAQEVAAALAQPVESARRDLADAVRLCRGLPVTVEAMAAGDLDLPRAAALARGSADLPPDLLPEFEAAVLPGAGTITKDSV